MKMYNLTCHIKSRDANVQYKIDEGEWRKAKFT